MVDKGAKLDVVDVDGWHDAGKIDTILETQKIMLEKRKMARKPKGLAADAKIIEPVYIEDGVTIRNSTVGPNVSIGAGTTLEDSTLRDSIVGSKCSFVKSRLHDSLIGDGVVVRGFRGHATIGDNGEMTGRSSSSTQSRTVSRIMRSSSDRSESTLK
jgi:glucose-1-phosphate thymidylyltransferase